MLIAAGVMSAPVYGETFGSMEHNLAMLHFVIGSVDLETGKYQDALKEFSEAIKDDPNSAEAYNGRACAYQSLNRNLEAIAVMSHGILPIMNHASLPDRSLIFSNQD
jgi:Tfp pilus assembly protein PilF